MQDRYAGDVGDFVKLGLLRAISPGRRLGVAWYRFPDEGHNGDGRHIGYLEHPHEYEALDPRLFHHLRDVVSRERSIASLFPVLAAATSADESLDVAGVAARARRNWRRRWFSGVLDKLSGCDLVFADPDNGIIDEPLAWLRHVLTELPQRVAEADISDLLPFNFPKTQTAI